MTNERTMRVALVGLALALLVGLAAVTVGGASVAAVDGDVRTEADGHDVAGDDDRGPISAVDTDTVAAGAVDPVETNGTDVDGTNGTDVDGTNGTDPVGSDAGQSTGDDANTTDANDPGSPDDRGHDATMVRVDVHENGSATWSVQYRYRLDSDEATTRWEERRETIEDDPEGDVADFVDRIGETVDAAENATERNMTISNATVAARTSALGEYGVVAYTFRWGAFAYVDVNKVEVGDALAASEFVLDRDTTMVVTWPETYNRSMVEPEPDDSRQGTVIWTGDSTTFVGGEPRLSLLETGTGEAVAEPEGRDWPSGWQAVAILLALVLLTVVVAVVATRRFQADGVPEVRIRGALEAPEEPEPSPELLSNEERVLRLLADNGGRMRQQDVVAELDWTEAKTSQIVSELRRDDEIEVFRIGRENVLSLPDEEAEA